MSTAPSLVQLGTLFAAVETGDIPTIEVFFIDDDIRAVIDATEASMQQSGLPVSIPWYRMPIVPDYPSYTSKVIFEFAVACGQFEVVEWFFAPARVEIMRATLAHAWIYATVSAITKKQPGILELLLQSMSVVFVEEHLQRMMQRILMEADTCKGLCVPDMLQLLLAHGLDVNATRPFGRTINRFADAGDLNLISKFVDEGVFVVGSSVFSDCWCWQDEDVARFLMQAGADCIGSSVVLGRAAGDDTLETVERLLHECFVDVDARDEEGRTALMLATSSEEERSAQEALAIVNALVNTNADVNLKDAEGGTALRYAMDGDHPEVVDLLLKHGADANVVLKDDEFLDELVACLDHRSASTKLELLLKHGVDPFAQSRDGVSLVERLKDAKPGQKFIDTHAQHFEKSELAKKRKRAVHTDDI